MTYGIVVDGQVLDFIFKKLPNGLYAFYTGHIYIGQVGYVRRSWTAISKEPHPFMPVHGFATRLYAAEFLLTLINT